MRYFEIHDWNIYSQVASFSIIVNRTNNPLESYNQRLNSLFNNDHPNLRVFVSVLRTHEEEMLRNYTDEINGLAQPPPHQQALVANPSMIPEEY